ncbi:MAG: ATP synthase F1 subunit epsilon [Magnetococcales bacterium]|nr:ATP synthase F1 subunit epsilon [Magnetococcales bacterium]
MAITLQLDLVTPDRLLVSKEVMSVTVPGQEGEFGVLADHTPLMSALAAGELIIDDGEQAGERYVISNGYCEVSGESVTVLVDRAISKESINLNDAKEELATALKALESAAPTAAKSKKIDPEIILQKRNRDFAEACIQVHGGRR